MDSRLQTVAPDLVSKLAGLDPLRLRRMRWAVSSHAVVRSGLSEPPISVALGRVASGEPLDTEQVASVRRAASGLDERAFDLHDREGDSARYLTAFARARAAASVAFAIESDSEEATSEVVYEAWAAVGDVEEIRSLIDLMLP